MRKHPWRMFVYTSPAFVLGALVTTLLNPTIPLWFALVVDGSAYIVYSLLLWRFYSATKRFCRRLPRAIRLGIFAWQQQAALERAERERLKTEQYQRLRGYQAGRLVRSIHVEPGHGYQPIGHIKPGVKPPQRPSPIAPQRLDDAIRTMELRQYLKRHPEMDRPDFDDTMAELAERMKDIALRLGVPVQQAFQEAWKVHDIEAPDVPHWIDWNAALEALKEQQNDG